MDIMEPKEIILDQDEGYLEKAIIDEDNITIETWEQNNNFEWYNSWSFTFTIDAFKKIQEVIK